MRNGIIIITLASVDIAEIFKRGGIILEVYEVSFCHNLEYKQYTKFVTEMPEKKRIIQVTTKIIP